MDLSKYYCYHHEKFEPFERTGYQSIEILIQFKGKPFDEVAVAYIQAYNPNYLRVVKPGQGTTLDAVSGRVTVYVDDNNFITKVSQEQRVGLPDGVAHGYALSHAFVFGLDSEEVRWHQDVEMYCMNYKVNSAGERVPFPGQQIQDPPAFCKIEFGDDY